MTRRPGEADASRLTVVKDPAGTWAVVKMDGHVVRAGFATMADAWRWIDRQEGEPISRGEKVSEWIAGKRDPQD